MSINTYKSSWLPQVTAPHDYVINGLKKESIGYSIENIDPISLKPIIEQINPNSVEFLKSQMDNQQPIAPLYVSKDNDVLDGHNRLHAYKNNPSIIKVVCIKVLLDKNDASRVLNKIEDKYNWEQELDAQPVLPEIEEVEEVKNNKTLELYSSKPISKNTKSGNFLIDTIKPSFDNKYGIEFENLYEMSDEECGTNPIESLARKWFPNYEELKMEAVKNALTHETYVLRKIFNEAKKKGFDGIKYGSNFVQTIDN